MAKHNIRFSDSAHYTITVAGETPQSVIEILASFFAGKFTCKYQDQMTRIEGLLKDQVALSGLLNYLNELHYIILSVSTNTGNSLPLQSNEKS